MYDTDDRKSVVGMDGSILCAMWGQIKHVGKIMDVTSFGQNLCFSEVFVAQISQSPPRRICPCFMLREMLPPSSAMITMMNTHKYPFRMLYWREKVYVELKKLSMRPMNIMSRSSYLTNAGATAREAHMENITRPLDCPSANGEGACSFTRIMLTL